MPPSRDGGFDSQLGRYQEVLLLLSSVLMDKNGSIKRQNCKNSLIALYPESGHTCTNRLNAGGETVGDDDRAT